MISLDYRDSRPLYQQVKDNLRRMMLTGLLEPDEKLPSVRSLATQLAINPTPSSGPMSPWRRRAMSILSLGRAASRPPAPGWMRSGGTGCWGSSTV
mgnify:CR=1 FL=1